jgi:hypothetical protein
MGDIGAQPDMYAPVLAFAHLFAAFWLVRMLFIMYKPGKKKAKGAARANSLPPGWYDSDQPLSN